MDLQHVGQSMPIRDAILKATGTLKYTGDLNFPNMLYAKMLFSPVAHAKIKSIDTSKAEALPGVKAVITHLNAPKVLYNSAMRFYEHSIPENENIFPEIVRFVGDRVAAVAAEDLQTAEKAIKLIEVEYEELPAVFDVEKALEEDAPKIHEGGNKVSEINVQAGNVDEAWSEADHIFEDRYEVPAIHHGAIEPHACIANYDLTGKLTVWTTTQNTFAYRILLCKIFDMPMSKVRIIKPPLGGAFGGKLEMSIEPVVALLAKMTCQHVRLELTRREVFTATRTRHSAVVYVKTGVKNDGTLVAHDIKVITNTGAYASSALNVAGAMSHKVFKMYKLPNLRFKCIPTYTNLPVAGAMRGYGSPQAFYGQQLQFNKIINTLKLDYVDFMRKNLVEPDSIEQVFKKPIGNPRPLDCVNKGAEVFGWDEKELRVDNGRYKRGIGMAVGCHGNGCFGAHRDYTAITIKMNEDGTCVLYTGTHDMGNGSVTVQTQIVAEVLGIKPEDVECVESDTDLVPWNLGDYASRGVFVSAHAVKKAAENVRAQLLEEAAKMMEVPAEKLNIKNHKVYNVEDPETINSLCEVIVYAQKVTQKEIIGSETFAMPSGPTSYGAHFAEVEVDTETGEVKVLNYVSAHDVGKAINPMGVIGAAEGGIHMGIGYAISEELTYDEKGKMTSSNLKKYHMLKASEMPESKVVLIEEGEAPGPYGAKSIGECAVVPAAPAVVSAIVNALGIDPHVMPLTPARILEALGK